jgi:hypothetical protein
MHTFTIAELLRHFGGGALALLLVAAVLSIEQVPSVLRELRQWCFWRRELVKGRYAKIPYTFMGYRGSSTNPETWSRLDLLLKILSQRPDFADGVSFVVTREDPFCGLDFDECLTDTGCEKPWVRSVLKVFSDCYAEVTPSGAGLRVWCLARLEKALYQDLPSGRVEAYCEGRHFTFTGQRYRDTPLELKDHQADINRLMARYGAAGARAGVPAGGRARGSGGMGPRYDGPGCSGPGDAAHVGGGAAQVNGHPFGWPARLTAGQRYNGFLSLAGTLALRGACDEAIVGAVEGLNRAQCDPPKTPGELAQDLRKILPSVRRWRG